jgi:L-fuconate dehydratase
MDAVRLGGFNEVLTVLVLAAKFGVPVCPHSGAVGLMNYHVRHPLGIERPRGSSLIPQLHVSLIDYVCVTGEMEQNVLEYVEFVLGVVPQESTLICS